MTAKPKTIKVKAVGVLYGKNILGNVSTYGEHGEWGDRRFAWTSTRNNRPYGSTAPIVDCLITVTLKGKRP